MSNLRRNPTTNRVEIKPVVFWLLAAFFAGMSGLAFVHIKNQQHAIGQQTRDAERQTAELRAANQVLAAHITNLTSRASLQRRLAEGFIAMIPIKDHAITRLGQPVLNGDSLILGTATASANSRFSP
ncbi:MAG TPA: hypothetical protein VIS74_06660 [Chthoniobacterales bacterium]